MPLIDALQEPIPGDMRHLACRFLVFVAVLLMPFGMQVAAAAPVHEDHSAAMPMEHCPEPDQDPGGRAALADCMLACAAALPAADLPAMAAPDLLPRILEAALIPALASIELEIATPPPRLS